jgi:hypothetical protein
MSVMMDDMGGKSINLNAAGVDHVLLTSNNANFCWTNSDMMCGVYNNKILGWVFYFRFMVSENHILDMIYLLTAIGLPPGGRSTVHIYTQTIHRTIQNKQYIGQHNNFGRVRALPHLG